LRIRSLARRALLSAVVTLPVVALVGCSSHPGDAGTVARVSTKAQPSRAAAVSTGKSVGATTTTRMSERTALRGCREAPRTIVRLVASGLAFPGPARLEQPRVLRTPRAFYFAARIVPPGKRRPVGVGVWAMKTLSRNAGVVAVNRAASAYSDWQRADLPLSATTRARVARVRHCPG
jgi:hypothetical protein